ncbi:hypothetical protein CDAR_293361, partial [Caerostris darwini]
MLFSVEDVRECGIQQLRDSLWEDISSRMI